jgi:PKD domain-containing protein/Ig-like domain-containing protein
MKSLIYPSNGLSFNPGKNGQAITLKWSYRLMFQKILLTTLCWIVVALFLSSKSYGQGSCPNDNCTSGDMTITKVELVLANGDPIPTTCIPGQPTLSVKLKVTFDATANTRYGFLIVGDLYVNNVFAQKVYQCYGEDFTQGTHTKILDQAFSYTCGTTLSLQHVYTAWDNQAPSTNICTHLNNDGSVNCTGIAPKCRYYADQSFTVAAPLAPDFTSLEGTCTNANRRWTFTSTTSGGKTPYSYTWDFGDGSSSTTTSNPVTHDYSTYGSKTVTLTVTDANSNTASISHTISVTACCVPSTAPASASASNNNFCPGGSTNLSVSGGSLGTNATWKWYTGSCGGTFVGSGSPLSVSPTTTTTYYVRAEGDCGTTTCAQVTVTVKTPSTSPTGATAASPTICTGSSTNISVVGGSLGTGAAWKWYVGGCGSGASIGTGPTISVHPTTTTTYYVRAEGDCGNSDCASVQVTVNPISVGGTVAADQTICSGSQPSGNFTLSGNVGSVVKWQKSTSSNFTSGVTDISNSTTTLAGSSVGGVTQDTWIRAIVQSGVCDVANSSSVKITVQQPISNNTIAADQTICSGNAPSGLTGSTPTGGSGSYTYQWQSKTSGSFADISGATSKDYSPGALTQTTQFRRIVSGGVCSNSTSNTVTITISPESAVYPIAGSNFCSTTPNSGTITLSSSYPGVSYQLRLASDNSDVQGPQIGTGSALSWSALAAGTYYVYGTGLAPTYCTSQTANAIVHEFDCSYFYTLTQGYYGSKNGKSCLGTTPVNTIKYLLGIPVNPVDLVTGTTNSVTVPATDAGANKLNQTMPGGSTPTALPAGQCTITTGCFVSPTYLTKQGKINNVLLSQTITLGLNARWENGKLLLFHIESGWLTTQAMIGCGPDAQPVTTCGNNTVKSILMNQNVINYLGANNSVQDLLNLANGVLGGTLTPGVNGVPSYADVNDAVDAINQAFDEGRRFLDFYANKQTCDSLFPAPIAPVITQVSRTALMSEGSTPSALAVTAYPNPYSDKVNFVIETKTAGQGSLEVYNMMGQKIKTVFRGFVVAGRQNFTLSLPMHQRGNLVYVFRIADKQITGKLLQLKSY